MATTYQARFACEYHDEPGACTDECLLTAQMMNDPGPGESMIYSDYLGGTSSVDVSGCHSPRPMPEMVIRLDAETKAVVSDYEHPEGECQCGNDDCPAWLEAEAGR